MKVFISGPYTIGDKEENTINAILAGEEVIKLGHTPFVPHLCHFWDKKFPHDYQYWIDFDLSWLEECDALIRLPGESSGADNEVKKALSLNIPVFFSLIEFEAFLSLKIRKYDEK